MAVLSSGRMDQRLNLLKEDLIKMGLRDKIDRSCTASCGLMMDAALIRLQSSLVPSHYSSFIFGQDEPEAELTERRSR